MKLIIDIDDNEYKHIREYYEKNDIVETTYSHIYNGIPLDKIKKQIDEQSAMHMDGEFYIRNFDVKWILEGNEVRE